MLTPSNLTTDYTAKKATDNTPLMFVDPSVPAVRSALASQQGSTWPTIPVNAPSSWNGWRQVPNGLEFGPAGGAKYSRWEWRDLPNKYRDDFYLNAAAIWNGIQLHSTFASPTVMTGFSRAIKAMTGVKI